jgi:hypothetical protein
VSFEGSVVGIPDALVRRVDELPDQLEGGVRVGFHAQAKPGLLLQVVPGLGRFLARDGKTIEVAPEPGAVDDVLDLFLNGAVRGALMHQRGDLPLHATTLLPPGRHDSAVAICGPSGAGKSTLATELSRRGWRLVADDLTRISWDGANALAWPGRPAVKLWADACEAAGRPVTKLRRVRDGLDKYFVPLPAWSMPTRLAAVVELRLANEGAVARVAGAERLALLSHNTYRPRQIAALGQLSAHVRIVARTASTTAVYRLEGARRLRIGTLADHLGEIAG